MAKTKKPLTAEDRLRALYDLQLIDSRIDRIRVVRGELPLEVEDLENEIGGLKTRLEKMEEENDNVSQRVSAYEIQIKESQTLIEKYEDQKNNVRNNREFESLNKEVEYQTLEIELCEKRIRECKAQQVQKAEGLENLRSKNTQRTADLTAKQSELDEIIAETQAEEEGLNVMFTEAGFEWREPGCSMCLAMNEDKLQPGERCASTSNRNFEGRQGKGGRTHLVSPEIAAASAITGKLTDAGSII